jgi:PIN domain nuclease of toxin-antitoxin system
MDLLLDTHALLWNIEDDPRLSARVGVALEDRTNRLVLSIASLWEISTNLANGRLRLPGHNLDTILSFMERWDIELLPVRIEHVRAAAELPFHHGDPFDRMLIAQAKVEGLRIVSRDEKVRLYEVDIFW